MTTKGIDRTFVHPDHRPECSRNKVKLILNNESRRADTRDSDTEERTGLRGPGQHRKLVYRANHQCWPLLVDCLIYDQQRQASGIVKVTMRVLAPERDSSAHSAIPFRLVGIAN